MCVIYITHQGLLQEICRRSYDEGGVFSLQDGWDLFHRWPGLASIVTSWDSECKVLLTLREIDKVVIFKSSEQYAPSMTPEDSGLLYLYGTHLLQYMIYFSTMSLLHSNAQRHSTMSLIL